jgi:signal transduction histidine kinase
MARDNAGGEETQVEMMAAMVAHRMSNLSALVALTARSLRESLEESNKDATMAWLAKLEREADDLWGFSYHVADRLAAINRSAHLVNVRIVELLNNERQRLLLDHDHIEVTIYVEPELPEVTTDEFALQYVLRDLATNAVEAMADVKERHLSFSARTGDKADRIEIAVTDTGAGIPRSFHQSMFAPFATTKPRRTGLGLWSDRLLMQWIGGSIALRESIRGKGTTFVLEVPLHPDSTLSGHASPASAHFEST